MDRVDVLDHGYVRLVDHMGDDLAVVNAARVSFAKESEWGTRYKLDEFTASAPLCLRNTDKKLLRYLAEHHHTSPFRHCVLSFEVYAPLMVMRQWGKYRVGSTWLFEESDDSLETWNESSRRYITEEPVFYIPDEWRSAPENKKQGSGEPVDAPTQEYWNYWTTVVLDRFVRAYNQALADGICAEQARLFLPAYAMYIRARWTVSLQGVLHFIEQRLHHYAQREIQLYAEAVRDLAKPHFPESFEVWGL